MWDRATGDAPGLRMQRWSALTRRAGVTTLRPLPGAPRRRRKALDMLGRSQRSERAPLSCIREPPCYPDRAPRLWRVAAGAPGGVGATMKAYLDIETCAGGEVTVLGIFRE